MYIDRNTIAIVAELITVLAAIVGFIVTVYKLVNTIKILQEEIRQSKKERQVLCYGLKGALDGLIEKGCNGPCKAARTELEKYLNETAHLRDK